MKPDIKKFVKKVCEKFELEAYYLPDSDVYCITKRGLAVRVFNTVQFYQVPKTYRFREIQRMLKVGLNHNLGENYKHQLYHQRKIGIKIA